MTIVPSVALWTFCAWVVEYGYTLVEVTGIFFIDLSGLQIEPIVPWVLYSTKYLRDVIFTEVCNA